MPSVQRPDFAERIRRAALRLRVVALCAAVLSATPALAIETQQSDSIDAKGAKSDVVFLAGKDVHIGVSSTHDVFAAGTDVRVDQSTADHLLTLSRTLSVAGSDVHNVIAAGRDLSFETGLARDGVVAFGQTVRFRPTFRIGGSAVAGGETVEMLAPVGGDLIASGDQITVDAAVGGNARLQARRLVIGPNARISGDLAYHADQVDISPQAVISGHKTILPAQARSSGAWKRAPASLADRIAGDLFGAAAFLVLTLGLTVLTPGLMARAGAMVGRNPLMAAIFGVIVLILGPAIGLVLLITVLGAPLAGAVLLVWGVLLIAAAAAAAAGLGQWIGGLARRGAASEAPGAYSQYGWTAVGALAICLLGAIPFVGGWVWLVACLLGAGALAVQGRQALAVAG